MKNNSDIAGDGLRPFAYAYLYPAFPPEGATVIRYGTGGREINGSKPIEAIPLYSATALEQQRARIVELEEALDELIASCGRTPLIHDGCGTTIIAAPHPDALRKAMQAIEGDRS